ncbi:MAG TPA: polysaccharide biosynthesis tyrosine autokinase [Bdellovibrionota bacterium]|nr:polysaccharide biosynthesis tyrosine autokinase [Bdellovibrionota bacterium]
MNPASPGNPYKSYGYPPYGTPRGGVSLEMFLEVLRKRWPLLILGTAIIGGIVTFKTIRQPYFYQATAQVVFSAQDWQSSISRGNALPQSNVMIPPSVLMTQESIIRSDAVMERVVQSLQMADKDKDPAKFDASVRRIKGMVSISREGDSHIFLIMATAGKPEEAMMVANSVAESYIKFNYDRTLATYRKSISWLSDELVDLEKKLEDAQKELISFIETEKLTSFGDEGSNQVPVLTRQAEEEDSALLRRLHSERVDLDLQLSQLLKRYRPAHPKVRKTEDDLAAVVQKIKEEEALVERNRGKRAQEIIGSKQKEIRYSILTRKVDINKQLYNTLIKKLKETDIDSAVVNNNIDVLEYAKTPGGPAGPNKQGRILFAFAFGMIFSLGLAMVLEFLDTSLRNTEEVQSYIRLPVLAAIPRLDSVGPDSEGPLLLDANADSPLREAYRVLRTNVRFSASSGHGKVIMVTSTDKGEGKSTIACNVGITNAEAGKRTLLIDTDFRVHSLSHITNVNNDRGLTQFLTEGGNLSDFIVESKLPNLWVVPSGPIPPKPALLLESERMKLLIQEAAGQYDQVILDAAPVSLVIDPVLVAHLVEGVILVIEAGRVSRTRIIKAIQQLETVKANLFGVVLNKEDLRKKAYYAYRGYYGYATQQA